MALTGTSLDSILARHNLIENQAKQLQSQFEAFKRQIKGSNAPIQIGMILIL